MDAVGDIKDRLGVEEVVGSYVQLRPAGRNLRGLCPFHNEKTPSFMVSPEKGIYHCFGCSEGGDIFNFVQKMEGLDFRGALEKLAAKAGVELTEFGQPRDKKRRQRLHEVLKAAAQYYHIQLSRNTKALDYATKRRGLSHATIKGFQLGFAPAGGRRLVDFLSQRNFTAVELIESGLAVRRQGGLSDLFRGRLMIPFIDQGHVIGFTGRLLTTGEPKYLNSPATKLFDKSRFIFALEQAREAIRSSSQAVIVEGNFDVISAHQAGSANVVALSGTALSVVQLKQLGRLSHEVSLAFDADSAGLKAAERAIPLSQTAGVNLSVATLPEGQDPDDIIRRDPGEWQKLLEARQPAPAWLAAQLAEQFDLSTGRGKADYTTRLSPVLTALQDSVERQHYIEQVARRAGVAPAVLSEKLKTSRPKARQRSMPPIKAGPMPPKSEFTTVLEALLSLAVTFPDTRAALADVKHLAVDEAAAAVLSITIASYDKEFDHQKLPKGLQLHESYVKILLLRGEEAYGSWAPLDRQVEAFGLSHRLLKLDTKQQRERLAKAIGDAEAAGDQARVQSLLKTYNQLLHQ